MWLAVCCVGAATVVFWFVWCLDLSPQCFTISREAEADVVACSRPCFLHHLGDVRLGGGDGDGDNGGGKAEDILF